jgi:hypothetical protein
MTSFTDTSKLTKGQKDENNPEVGTLRSPHQRFVEKANSANRDEFL